LGELALKIASIELIEIRLPLVHFFETSFGRTTERHIVLAHILDQNGADGWGECTAGEGPFYSEEWTQTAWYTLAKFLAPLLVGREIGKAADVFDVLNPIRGHRMAKASLETACWDLEARCQNVSLSRHLGGTLTEIPCGVSIGIQDSVELLIEKIEKEVEAGYQRIKIKIKPGWDYEVLKSVRKRFPEIGLMADANSAYSLSDMDLLRSFDDFDLMMIEQPLAHDDMFNHAELQRQIRTPVCLDESIRTPDDAFHAIKMQACHVVNLKLGRLGGHREAARAEKVCRDLGVPVWCGGMLESGIGRAHNIAMATLPGFVLPGDVSASKRYWTEDIIEPEVTVTNSGTIPVPDGPGIGYRIRRDRIDELAVRREIFNANN
jgi:o-succinylbenzoate synthase